MELYSLDDLLRSLNSKFFIGEMLQACRRLLCLWGFISLLMLSEYSHAGEIIRGGLSSLGSDLGSQLFSPTSSSHKKKVYHLPFSHQSEASLWAPSLGGFSLLHKGNITPEDAVKMYLRNGVIDSKFGIVTVKNYERALSKRLSKEFRFYISGFPLCDYTLKAHITPGEDPIIMGTVPDFDPGYVNFSLSDFPTKESDIVNIASSLHLSVNSISLSKVSSCLKADGGILVPSHKVDFLVNALPHSAIVSSTKVYSMQREFFGVTGSVTALEKNPDDGATNTYSVEFTGDTHLTTTQLTTTTGSVARAANSAHQFSYSPTDPEYAEVNAFMHAELTYQWFKSFGYEWTDGTRLTLRLREGIKDAQGKLTQNNALYLPAGLDGNSSPMIAVADGDGAVLKGLPLDLDVVGHEFGHHILFATLKSTKQLESQDGSVETPDHSAALHEGLADYFTFAQTGDACLAESICPDGTQACVVMTATKRCLRSGELDFNYNSPEYWALGAAFHLKGQVVSGTMWDIQNSANVDPQDFKKIAFASVDYLLSASSYSDWLIALMSADRDLFDGKYGCEIASVASSRGFDTQVEEHISDCKNFASIKKADSGEDSSTSQSDVVDKEEASSNVGSETDAQSSSGTTKRKSSGKNNFCGTIAPVNSKLGFGSIILLTLFTLPLFFALQRKSLNILRK
ncbi:MAG: hypothetical protein R3B45_00630 [Bdellovibrionota bacterium]